MSIHTLTVYDSCAVSGGTTFTDSAEYLNLNHTTDVDDAASTVGYTGRWGHPSGEGGTYSGTPTDRTCVRSTRGRGRT